MKNSSTALLMLMLSVPNIASAIPQSSTASARAQMSVDSNKQVAMLHKTLDTTKRALNRYYSNEKSWPASLKVLESKGYLPNNYTSLLGDLISNGVSHPAEHKLFFQKEILAQSNAYVLIKSNMWYFS